MYYKFVAACLAVLLASLSSAAAQTHDCYMTVNGQSFDISPLMKPQNPGGNLANSNYVVQQLANEGDQDSDSYTYYMNICGPLVNNNNFDDAVVQYKFVDTQSGQVLTPPQVRIVGSIDGNLRSLHAGDLRWEYGAGQKRNSTCNQAPRTSVVILLCADVGLGSPIFAGEAVCGDYSFVWSTCAACPLGSPIRNACPNPLPCSSSSSSSKGLSTGSILLIVFFTLLGVYLLFGMLYNRWVHGAKGLDQLPNLDFWSSTWTNAKGGCAFLFSCIGSAPRATSATPKAPAVKYQEMSDEKIEEALDADLDAEEDLYG